MDLAKDVYQGAVSAESVVRRCSVKKVLLKNLQENICAGVILFFNKVAGLPNSDTGVFSCKFYEILKNPFFYRTPPVAAVEAVFKALSDASPCQVFTYCLIHIIFLRKDIWNNVCFR